MERGFINRDRQISGPKWFDSTAENHIWTALGISASRESVKLAVVTLTSSVEDFRPCHLWDRMPASQAGHAGSIPAEVTKFRNRSIVVGG
jgi:hypothetical protein